jgi:hypothetical protein
VHQVVVCATGYLPGLGALVGHLGFSMTAACR